MQSMQSVTILNAITLCFSRTDELMSLLHTWPVLKYCWIWHDVNSDVICSV